MEKKLNTYTAFVKCRETNKKTFITRDYAKKKQFRDDLKCNGYIVYRIELKVIYDYVLDSLNCTPEDFTQARNDYKNKTGFFAVTTITKKEALKGGDNLLNEVKIKRAFQEDNRIQSIILHYEIYDMYKGNGDDECYYITEKNNPDKILMAITKELWSKMFENDYIK